MHQESTNSCQELQQELSQKSDLTSFNNQQLQEVLELFDLPFNDLLFKSATVHRQNQNQNEVQISTLLSIKTGSCPENCKYCPQSAPL